jgi:TetR/AcrR family transcriptional regulator, repressor for uid operon
MTADASLAELLTHPATAADDEESDRTTQRILDAALAETAVTGLRRLTVEDVVRRAGVARMTVYRRYPRREDLVQALVARETQRFLKAVADGNAREDDPFDKLVEAFIAAVEFTRQHPMLRRAREAEPGWIIEGVAADDARLLAVGTAFIARYIHGDRPGPPSRRARWIADVWARLFITYAMVPPSDPDFASDRELRRFARDVLAPMVTR